MTPKSAIEKGKMLEEYVCEQLREKGLDVKAYRSHGSGNGTTEKADIWTSLTLLGQNAGFECKNHKTIHIKEWWNQTKKLESLGREPILVYRIQGQNMGDTLCTVYLDTLLELIKASYTPQNAPQSTKQLIPSQSTNREFDYAISQLKVALSKVQKHLND